MSTAVAGIGTAMLAIGIVLSAQSETPEARRQVSGGVRPQEVPLAPATQSATPEQERAGQALLEHLRSRNIDVRTLPAPRPEVTCAIRIIKPDMDVDPGIHQQLPQTTIESKIRIVGDSPCLRLGTTAAGVPAYQVERYTLTPKRIELATSPQPPGKR